MVTQNSTVIITLIIISQYYEYFKYFSLIFTFLSLFYTIRVKYSY